jgi:hypothetical protein
MSAVLGPYTSGGPYCVTLREYYCGKYHCTVDLLFDWFGISCLTTGNYCFYFQNRLIQTSQTGGQQYSYTFPFSIPWSHYMYVSPKHGINYKTTELNVFWCKLQLLSSFIKWTPVACTIKITDL